MGSLQEFLLENQKRKIGSDVRLKQGRKQGVVWYPILKSREEGRDEDMVSLHLFPVSHHTL